VCPKMKIEKIVKKSNRDIIIHLDNNEDIFLSREVLMKSGLRKNDELTESRISFLINENKKYYTKQAAFKFLGRRLHSINELKTKLKLKKYDLAIINSVMDELKISGYLNDEEFSSRYADEKIKLKAWGRIKIESELRKKGIDNKIVSNILNERFGNGNEIETARELADKKAKILFDRGLDQTKVKEKLFSFLYSRGYDYETSKEAIESVMK